MNIAILAGGLSPERDVSLTSGSLIANALMKKGHRVLLIDAYLGMEVDESRPLSALFRTEEEYRYSVREEAPNLDALKASRGGEALLGPNVVRLCLEADVTFLALHGAAGENGQTQATLDSYGIPYTGSGYVGSLLAMDKDIAKRILASYGIRTPKGITLDMAEKVDLNAVIDEIGFPMVVKPCSCGSSVGISMVNSRDELIHAVETARKYESVMLVEQRIVGREFTVGILDGRVLPPVEIIPKCGFYDYKNKYQAGLTDEVCPADLSAEETARLSAITLDAFKALRLRDYSRFDYIRDEEGTFWCLEANTLPGMTPTSLLPQEAAAVGIDYGNLCEKIAYLALKH
jgi:D-alanine-D-alanine ligase